MSSERPRPSTFRCRELTALAAVLLVGGALVYTLLARGSAEAPVHAFIAFFVAVTLVVIGYGGGMFMDRLTERHPMLAKTFHSKVLFLILPPLVLTLAYLGWQKHDIIFDFAREKSEIALDTVHDFVMGGEPHAIEARAMADE